VLYGVRSIARYIRKEEAVYLPEIMKALPMLPQARPRSTSSHSCCRAS
jgi:hypothetical protein